MKKNSDTNKVFCIGSNKTGTTSLEKALIAYGLSLPKQKQQEKALTEETYATNYSPLKDFVPRFDAFQDQPFSQGDVYVACDALFPNSKFILTERNSEEWFQSLIRFHSKKFAFSASEVGGEDFVKKHFNYLYEGYSYRNIKRFLTQFTNTKPQTSWNLLYNKEYYIKQYEDRNLRIKKYFLDRQDKLLVLDLSKEENTKKIGEFIEKSNIKSFPMPHYNKSNSSNRPTP